jgi:diguanylate cyclase (GGDEF)-like protein
MVVSGGGSRAASSAVVARVAAIVGASQSLPRVLDRIVAALAAHGYPGSGITLVNEHDELYVVAYDGPPDEDILALRLPVGQGIMGTVAAECQSLLVADLDNPDGPLPAYRTVGGHAHLRSLLAVPIITDHAVIGVLEVDSTEPGTFTVADLAVFERVASEIAGAVREAAPLELAGALLRRRVHEVMILEETTRALASDVDLDTTYQTVVRYASLAIGSERVRLLQVQGDHLLVVGEHGGNVADAGSDVVTPLPASSVIASLGGGAAWLAPTDAAAALGFPMSTVAGRVIVAVPVRAGDAFCGAMFVISRTALGFDPAELRLLEGISDLAGLSISNAERFQRLANAADTDLVTGLHNRARFERELAAKNGTKLAILSIDLDRLKLTNDTYGHEAGDAVLEHVGEALDKLVGGRGPLARTGADEFAVLLPGASTLEAVALAEELRVAMYGLVPPYGTARISVGVAGSMDGGDARSTWSAADAALGLAKQWGRDRVECARADTPPAAHTPTRWDELAAQLVDARDIDSVYQPVVRLHDHSIVGYEALARPFGAAHDLSVEELFAAAHRIGLSRELDWLSRRAAVRGARALPAGAPLFINCSIDALLNPVHGVDQMLLVLDWAERAPQDVVLEINEREVVHDLDRFRVVLAMYRQHGFRFAVDDVGEGRSTLEVMATAEPEFVKIARSLTVSAQQLGHRSAIHAVVAFARTSGAIVIAEGIEGEREAELMAAMDVDHGQGWWLGRPMQVAAS